MSKKNTNYFTSSQPAKKCKVNDNSVKTKDATTALCDTASAIDHMESGHTALSSVDHVESGHTALSSVDHVESKHATPSSEDLPKFGILTRKINSATDTTG
jgi:hypothetical protein